jgi:hypothetical protein
LSILKRAATQLSGLRWGFKTASNTTLFLGLQRIMAGKLIIDSTMGTETNVYTILLTLGERDENEC